MILKGSSFEIKLFILGSVFFISALLLSVVFDIPYLMLLPFAVCIGFIFLKDIRYAFYALIFALPISFQFLEKYDMPDEPLMILNAAFFLFFCLFNYAKIALKSILLNPLFLAVLFTIIWLVIAVLLSENIVLSSKFLLKKSWYILPFLFYPIVLFQDKKVIIQSYQLLFFSLFSIVVIVLIRFSAVGFAFDKVHDPLQPFFQNHVMYG
ncbi:MAG: hypothetical protein IPF62_16830, partial [Bacteroidetes bacterium]|nr:hypothetical protein [Bacteroidota bacterium]